MKNKTWWLLGIIVIVLISIAGKMHMDQRHKELTELHIIQRNFANYVYQNFVVITDDDEKFEKISKKYEENKEHWTDIEYLNKLKEVQIYYDIEKIEFTNITITPMNSLQLQFKINDVYEGHINLNTISVETDTWFYNMGEYNGPGPYYLEKKKQATHEPIPDSKIIYYDKGIN